MSETDDRMERAKRIREMRESTGSDDEPSSEADATAEADAATDSAADAATTATADAAADEADAADVEQANAAAGGAVEEGAPEDVASAGDPVAPLGEGGDFSLPDADTLDDAAAEPAEAETGGAARARGSVTATEPSVRVLEFTVGDQVYCIDIDSVEEIVKRETVTRVPNTPAYVEGVVDLRGQITTILDTKRLLDVEESGRESLLVVFAPDAFEEHGTVGWVVDEVRQVVPVMDSQVRQPPEEVGHVRGVVDRDDEDDLVVWIKPGLAMAGAVDDAAE